MKLGKYEDPTPEHGVEFMIGIAYTDQFEEDETLEKAIMTLRNTGFAADQTFTDKINPVVGNVLFRVRNEAGKMHYYGGDFHIELTQKVLKFILTHTYTLKEFEKANEEKLKRMKEQQKALLN